MNSASAQLPLRSLLLILIALFTGLTFPDGLHAESFTVVTEHFPPFSYETDAGPTGFSVEFVEAILKEAQTSYTLRLAVWDGAYKLATEQPSVLIFSIARTPARENLFQWVGELATYQTGFYKLSERVDIQVNRFNELAGYRLSMLENGPAHQMLNARKDAGQLLIDPDRDTVLSIDRLLNKRADIVACPDVVMQHYLQDRAIEASRVTMLPPLLRQSGLYLAASKNTRPELVEPLRKAYERVIASSTVDHLRQKYQLRQNYQLKPSS